MPVHIHDTVSIWTAEDILLVLILSFHSLDLCSNSCLQASLEMKQESSNVVLLCFTQNHFLLERDIVHTEEVIRLIKFDVLFTTAHFHYSKMRLTFKRMCKRSPDSRSIIMSGPSFLSSYLKAIVTKTATGCLMMESNESLFIIWFCH